jgi:predicted transcriptional regulator of viral defense system
MKTMAMMAKHAPEPVTPLLARAKSEFLEMPGLRLTTEQAARLWAVDRATSERILDSLAETGFLWRNARGAYLRRTVG